MNQRCISWAAVACLLLASFCLFLQNLGSPYITLWDEAVHVNVIENLAEHCCLPQLHRSAAAKSLPAVVMTGVDFEKLAVLERPNIGIEYRDWTNDTLWLHKPLLPFYVTAGVYRLFGHTLWALRLPGAIFAVLTAAVIYLIGRTFFDELIGFCGAAIFCLNPYTNDLVHGREFSGFPDLAFALFTALALYLVLDWLQRRSVATLRWLGLVLGLGYLCKGGLALAPFAVLSVIIVLSRRTRDFIPALQSALIFAAMALLEQLYWLTQHPVEFRYEKHLQLFHLFKVIEGHGGPWQYYVAQYWPAMLLLPFIPFVYFSIGWALAHLRPDKPGFVLSLWTLAYLVPLSLAASKIENFVFAVLPVVSLLAPLAVMNLMKGRRFALVIALCVSSSTAYALPAITRGSEHPERWTFFILIVVFAATLGVLSRVRTDLKETATGLLTATMVGLLFLYALTDVSANSNQPPDSSAQLALRQSGTELRPLVDRNSVILFHSDSVKLAYLYMMYWSRTDVLDVCREPQPDDTVSRLRGDKDVYLLTDTTLPYAPLAVLPSGNLYAISHIPYETWGPVATGACPQQFAGKTLR